MKNLHSKRKPRMSLMLLALIPVLALAGGPQVDDWYTQGSFEPEIRIEVRLRNKLQQDRENSPVIIPRKIFPLPDVHEMWVTVVDPSLPPAEAPSEELLALQGGHQMREESHGHAIFYQLDDLDKDGIWDELFFQTDMKALEEKTIYVYIGHNNRGWNKHGTHANIGSYCRHLMPFWESEHVGWKIWFANSVDVYAKRSPVLMSNVLYMENQDGYGVSLLDEKYGSDIQSVAGSFGGGAICLFEHPQKHDSVSTPRFTPTQDEKAMDKTWNAGQISDTRYAYEIIVNGPLRSMVKIKTMHWNTGEGSYALEQYYTAYAKQNYSSCKVRFTQFHPKKTGVTAGCGIRKKPNDEALVLKKGIIISSGQEAIRDPEKIDDREEMMVDFVGKALVVPDRFMPEYRFIKSRGGNHTFSVTTDPDQSFEYLLFAAWSEGEVLNTQKEFEDYVFRTASEFNDPVAVACGEVEKK